MLQCNIFLPVYGIPQRDGRSFASHVPFGGLWHMYASRLSATRDNAEFLPTDAAAHRRDAIPGELSVETVCGRTENDALHHEWRALGQDAGAANPFFLLWFLGAALKHLDREGAVRLCTVRRKVDGRLVGLMPVTLGRSYAKLPIRHLTVWQHPHAYSGAPLIRRGYERQVYTALLHWIDTRPHGARFLRFTQLPFDRTGGDSLAAACRSANRPCRIQSLHERAILTGGQDFDAVMRAAMSGKKRKELRRQANRFAELGHAEFADLPVAPDSTAVDAFLRLENEGWKSAAPGGMPLARSEAETAFFREAMAAGAREGGVICTALTLDGAPTAILFSLRSGTRLSAFKTSFDERHGAYSPGVRLLIDATERMLGCHDICIFDSCAKPDHPVVNSLWRERLPVAQINVPANNPVDRGLLALAAAAESAKENTTGAKRRHNPKTGDQT